MSLTIKSFALSLLAVAAHAQESTPGATPEAPPSCPLKSGSYSELNAVGVVLINQGSVAAGEDCLARAVAATVPTYRALSDIAAARGDWRRAAMISSLGQQVDGTPASSFFHAKRLIQGGDVAGSLQILDTLSAANSNDPGFLHVHGIAQFRNGLTTEAVASLSRAVELSPNNKGFAEDLASVQAAIADAEVAAAAAAAAGQ
jgi:hypothetical protein